ETIPEYESGKRLDRSQKQVNAFLIGAVCGLSHSEAQVSLWGHGKEFSWIHTLILSLLQCGIELGLKVRDKTPFELIEIFRPLSNVTKLDWLEHRDKYEYVRVFDSAIVDMMELSIQIARLFNEKFLI